jgi:hypothetical protein
MTNFPIKIAFAMTINKAHMQTLKCSGIYSSSLVFPTAKSMWYFADPLHLTMFAVTIIEGHRKRIENNRLINQKHFHIEK